MTGRLRHALISLQFWRKVSTNTLAAIGFEATALGLFDLVQPGRILQAGTVLVLAVAMVAVTFGIYRAWPRPVGQRYASPSAEVRLVIGDLFDRADNLVIGMTDTFDTAVPHVIHRHSIQGQFLARIYAQDQAALDTDLDRAVQGTDPSGTIVKQGKRVRYPVGTVAVIRHARRHFFCVAYSSMDEDNRAQATIDGLWRSLSGLWDAVRVHANGEPIAMPIIGGGQSRISQILPAQDSVRLIALSYMLASRHTKVCDRLDIVVRPDDVDKLKMDELQAFLESL